MKNTLRLLSISLLFFSANAMVAQTEPVKDKKNNTQIEEKVPYLLKFEPDFTASEAKERARIKFLMARIDTMDISKSKRRKLIADLYNRKKTKQLTNVLLADTKFVDDEQ